MLKRLVFIIIGVLAAAATVYAVPAAPHFHDLQQPDGSTIAARQWGDEHSHGWATDAGHTIVFDKMIKGWAYAVHDSDGNLSSSSILVNKAVSPPSGIQKNLRPRQTSPLRVLGQSSVVASSQTVPQLSAPTVGTKSLPVILIGFADFAFTKAKADFDNLLFGSSGNTLTNYYLQNSYNKLIVNGGTSGVFGPVTSNEIRTYYGSPSGTDKDGFAGTLVYEAVSKAVGQGFKFAPFVDQSKSCYVDVVVITHPGTGQESGFDVNDIWSHSWDLNSAKYSGNSSNGEFVTAEPCSRGGFIKVNSYTIQPELAAPNGSMIGVGVFSHEFGHVLGLPDLYDTDSSSNGAGNWTVMASGSWLGKTIAYNKRLYNTGDSPSHLDPWSKFYLGWISPTKINGISNLPIAAASSSSPDFYALGSGTPTSGEFFLVENRQKSGFDSYIPGSGLLVWHLDGTTISSLFSTNTINNNECLSTTSGACALSNTHYGVSLVQADNLMSLEKNVNRGDVSDPFIYPNILNDSTSPSTKLWSGAASGWEVTTISASAAIMRATFKGTPISPAVSNESAIPMVSSATLNGNVNDDNATTSATFQYGQTNDYGNSVSAGTIAVGSGPTTVTAAVSGLSCNTTYHFRLLGNNSAGTTIGTDHTFLTTPCVPGAPTIISASAGNAQASISFAPPAYVGVSDITGFTVIPSIGPAVTGSEIPISVTGLSNGTAYTFTVSATNAAGTGLASGVSVSVTPGVVVIDTADATGYQLLKNAYDADTSAKKIKLLADTSVGGLAVNSSNVKGDVTIVGGYNDGFSGVGGLPSILGNLTLSAGTTRFQNVIVRAPGVP